MNPYHINFSLTPARELKPQTPPLPYPSFCARTLTLYSPPYLLPHSARELSSRTPPLPSPSAHLKDFVFIKPWFYHPFLKPTLNPSVCPGNAPHVPGRECRSLTKNKYHDQKKNTMPMLSARYLSSRSIFLLASFARERVPVTDKILKSQRIVPFYTVDLQRKCASFARKRMAVTDNFSRVSIFQVNLLYIKALCTDI